MTHRDMPTVDEAKLVDRAQALMRTARRTVIPLERSGLEAATRVAQVLLPSQPPPGLVCGSYRGSHTYGGSTPEGQRHYVRVVLPDAVVEGEEYDSASDGATYVYVWTEDEALRARIHTLVGTG